ncbi:3'(2'),5'-bisphosphate nucleotidase [Cystobasidiomycetes sp. EMM_F5]
MSGISSKYDRELQVAVAAVLKACHVAQATFQRLVNDETVTKKDKSPVTVADYAAQALVSSLLAAHFPDDALIGEEDAKDLRTDEQASVKDKIIELANGALSRPLDDEKDQQAWKSIGQGPLDTEEWLKAIDRGNAEYSKKGRVWALDPIDGTKGFLRGGQYAICLALLQDGAPVLGVMGTPNLPQDYNKPGEKGALFVATKGDGAYQRNFTSSSYTPIKMASIDSLSQASFCESVEAGHTSKPLNARIAQLCGITKPPVCMDSQAKYCSIARGDGHVYLRLPVQAGYEEKIWDHASGALLVAEAGGKVSDMNGKPLDFSLGRTLAGNKGIVAAPAHLHGKVIESVQQALVGAEQGKL